MKWPWLNDAHVKKIFNDKNFKETLEELKSKKVDPEHGKKIINQLGNYLKSLIILEEPRGFLSVGNRLIIFCEIDEAENFKEELECFIHYCLPYLPERMGLVISGVPRTVDIQAYQAEDYLKDLLLELSLPREFESEIVRNYVKFEYSALSSDEPSNIDLLSIQKYARTLGNFIRTRNAQGV
jgi:hypothetical protein